MVYLNLYDDEGELKKLFSYWNAFKKKKLSDKNN